MKNELTDFVQKYCLCDNLSTYDPYDIWKTDLGLRVKVLFNASRLLGSLPALIFSIYDQFLNNQLRLGYQKQEYPIVRAMVVQTLVNLYKSSNDYQYLKYAKLHLDWLISNYSKGYSGYCWGANMIWASKNGIYKKNTPYITNTPYVLEALIKYQEASKDNQYQKVIASIYDFISRDLIKLVTGDNVLGLSYAPVKEPRVVVNANAYALYSLSLLNSFRPEKSRIIERDILKLFNFILQNQNLDGSWWYYSDRKSGNFIDCFHSCFILKNLIKASKYITLPVNNNKVVDNGYKYILENFYDHKIGLFKRFSKRDKVGLVKFDLYDNAEMLNLTFLYKDFERYDILKNNIEKHFIRKNDIYSAITLLNIKTNKNMLRWAILPYLYALSIDGNRII